jgi:hypothetical protein
MRGFLLLLLFSLGGHVIRTDYTDDKAFLQAL